MAQPLHILKHEHRVIERALHALDGVCLRLEWNESVPVDSVGQLVDFIRLFADRYHHYKEEECLFPALEKQGIPREGGPLGIIESQHEIERGLTAEMESALQALASGDPTGAKRFIQAAHRYTDHLLAHMEKEDFFLFKLADEMLGENEKMALSEAFMEFDSRFGAGARENYEKRAAELEEKWAL